MVDNGGCGDPVLTWCENRCGAWPLCHTRDGVVLNSANNSAGVGPTVRDPVTGDLASVGSGIENHTLCPASPQCDSFLVQTNMSNPKEHCNLGFNHLCLAEGGAFHYTLRLGEMPPGPVEVRVSGEHLQYDAVVVFTPEDFSEPHEVTIALYENLDITGNYWMDLRHNFTLLNDDANDDVWWSTREPSIAGVSGWTPGKLWCDSTGAAMPLTLPVLVLDNDVSFPDDLTWQMETLVRSDSPVVRGPYTLDSSFFSASYSAALDEQLIDDSSSSGWAPDGVSSNVSGFWTTDMPDAAFRIVGAANGSFVFRRCPDSAPSTCNETCAWRDVIQYDRNAPTIFIAFDDPCFLAYPPLDGASVDLYVWVSTEEPDSTVVVTRMERAISWEWVEQPELDTELLSAAGARGAVGFVARSYVDSGSSATSIDVRSYIGTQNLPGLEAFHSGLQLANINSPEVFLVPPPPPAAWGAGWLVDDRPRFASAVALPSVESSCSSGGIPCAHGGICIEAVYRGVVTGGLRELHGSPHSLAGEIATDAGPLWHSTPFADGYACTCNFTQGGAFCEAGEWYTEFDDAEVLPPEVYNVTLRAGVAHSGSSLRWSEVLSWDTDECLVDNGGCGDPVLTWCENRCGAWPLCHTRD
eukprot:COSAG02_NODE_7579_length_2950_cov_19.547176_3_plen_637_part_01